MAPLRRNDDIKNKRKPANEKPISLHPLTVEEALRKAMGAPPRDDEPKTKPKKQKTVKTNKRNDGVT